MLHVYTVFDGRVDGRPLMAGVYDSAINKLAFYSFYIKGTGKTYYDINATKQIFKNLMCDNASSGIIINDYKQHIIGFDLDYYEGIYDIPSYEQIRYGVSQQDMRVEIVKALKSMKNERPQLWHSVRAQAAVVYAALQRTGAIYNYTKVNPIWDMNTYSGRSRSSVFSIQGVDSEALISNMNGDPIYIHFDWVSADIRMAAVMSGDTKLLQSFYISDPYEYVAENLDHKYYSVGKLDRDEAKIALLSSMYNVDSTGPIMDFYSGLKQWINKSAANLRRDGYIKNILGREYRVGNICGKNRTERSAFNAAIQGSVACAMQRVIHRVYNNIPDSLLVETHDSLVVTAQNKPSEIQSKITTVANIMLRPFAGILEEEMVFPLVVSVGKEFGKWKQYKRFNK